MIVLDDYFSVMNYLGSDEQLILNLNKDTVPCSEKPQSFPFLLMSEIIL